MLPHLRTSSSKPFTASSIFSKMSVLKFCKITKIFSKNEISPSCFCESSSNRFCQLNTRFKPTDFSAIHRRSIHTAMILCRKQPHMQFYLERKKKWYKPRWLERFMYRYPRGLFWIGVTMATCLMCGPVIRDWIIYPIIMSNEEFEEYARLGKQNNKDKAVYGIGWQFPLFNKPINFVHPEVAKRNKLENELKWLEMIEEEKAKYRAEQEQND